MCHMYSFPCKAKYNFLNLNIFIFGEKIWNKLRTARHDLDLQFLCVHISTHLLINACYSSGFIDTHANLANIQVHVSHPALQYDALHLLDYLWKTNDLAHNSVHWHL